MTSASTTPCNSNPARQQLWNLVRARHRRSGIFRTRFGFHIAKRNEKAAAGPREPGMAQRGIEAYLTSKRRHEAMERGLEALRAEAEIARMEEVRA